MQKEISDHKPITKRAGLSKKWPTEQHDIDFSLEEQLYLGQQGFDNAPPIVVASNSLKELPTSLQPITGLAAAVSERE